MKKALALVSLFIASITFAQNYHYDAVKNLSVAEVNDMVKKDKRLSNDEKSKMSECLNDKTFKFSKNTYYACLKQSIAREKFTSLFQEVAPDKKQIDVATPSNGKVYRSAEERYKGTNTNIDPESIQPE